MKLQTSLTTSPRASLRIVVAALWIVTVVSAACVTYTILSIRSLQAENPVLDERLANLRQQINSQTQSRKISLGAVWSVKTHVAEINKILGISSEAPTSLLRELEAALPRECYLTTLIYKQVSGEATVSAESQDARALNRFLGRLEQAPGLVEVSLKKQERLKAADRTLLRYEVSFRSRI